MISKEQCVFSIFQCSYALTISICERCLPDYCLSIWNEFLINYSIGKWNKTKWKNVYGNTTRAQTHYTTPHHITARPQLQPHIATFWICRIYCCSSTVFMSNWRVSTFLNFFFSILLCSSLYISSLLTCLHCSAVFCCFTVEFSFPHTVSYVNLCLKMVLFLFVSRWFRA